jgi:TonB family protein
MKIEGARAAGLFALALAFPAWSAGPNSCSDADTSAVRAKLGEYILRVPDAPQNRWVVSKADESWRISEYKGLRVSIRCNPVAAADAQTEISGEVELRFAASRTTRFPTKKYSGVEHLEWSEWIDHAVEPAAATGTQNIPFRKHEGKVQFGWDYDATSPSAALMPAADINRFFSAVAKVVKGASQRDYYPAPSIRRRETGTSVVQSCVGPNGKLLRAPTVVESSGFAELDKAAIKMAKDTEYSAGTENGVAMAESCVEFPVRFAMK